MVKLYRSLGPTMFLYESLTYNWLRIDNQNLLKKLPVAFLKSLYVTGWLENNLAKEKLGTTIWKAG